MATKKTVKKKAKSSTKPKIGRPTKYREDFHPEDFVRRSKAGESITEIAAEWEVSRQRIYDWAERHEVFRDAIKKGRDYLDAYFHKVFKAMMYGKIPNANITAAIFLAKNAVKWTDRIEEQTTVTHISQLEFVDDD